jgi:hypothetical protein
MSRIFAWLLLIVLAGCTTLRPITADQNDLASRIASGELIKPGDRVAITKKDGVERRFVVASVSAASIDGKHESIPIDQVASIQKRQFNPRRTLLLVGAIVGGAALTVLIARAIEDAAVVSIFRSSN